jgi:hypothetical protein
MDVRTFDTSAECIAALREAGYDIWATDLSQARAGGAAGAGSCRTVPAVHCLLVLLLMGACIRLGQAGALHGRLELLALTPR